MASPAPAAPTVAELRAALAAVVEPAAVAGLGQPIAGDPGEQVIPPGVDWDAARLDLEWRYWSAEERGTYTAALTRAKPLERQPLEAARWAAGLVVARRRLAAWAPYLDRHAHELAAAAVSIATPTPPPSRRRDRYEEAPF
jgi:hypothetical protein